ncbi:hypothetical protein X762_30890 [Mesorhizobium sp. LSHC426A00]|nr:hypothetical protein X770_22940 [Mesorhizobium sp. LSJC269B00]ESX41079.1 hypothetical protein X762_30890 [Mesorhizobium sp. LSHC426A00]ESX45655.1 hypothetical protein X761_31905 [Mesorhizobium sp. LSHC424B00]ESX64577.1 hypothetical protein X758_31465 [Mesorhizobium sp. LSHC416B00]ESZ02745.1 hypothetical protein X736_29725 [Mesorhizobium sp. L2C089B000]
MQASVEFVEALGSTSYVHSTLTTGETIVAERRSFRPKTGDQITFHFAPASARLFGEDGGRYIPRGPEHVVIHSLMF